MRVKNASFLCGISSFHHDVFVSGEHNTPALSLQDESPGLVLRADVAAELRSLRRYYHLSMAWNRNQSIPAVYIVNWVQRELQHAPGERYGS